MENTGSFLFDNSNARFYLYAHAKTQGPLTAEEIFERISRGEASIMDHVWRMGWTDFKRICDEKEFEVLVPKKPPQDSLKAIKEGMNKKTESPPPGPAQTSYYLFVNNTQYGPFNPPEVEKIVSSGKVDASAFVWMAGWPNWKAISDVAELAKLLVKAPAKLEPKLSATKTRSVDRSTARADKRSSPRKPLVARLFVAHDEDVIIAVCRDISVGGMQVLTDRVPGQIGTKIKLNVSPADAKRVAGFTAEGQIVRVLEDGRGFSFRFTKLTGDAKKMIEKYIEG